MPKLRQLPLLYLRGSLANVTMWDLTAEQRQTAADVSETVANSNALIAHKIEFMNQLGRTIGGDYNDDRRNRDTNTITAAEHEYRIVIWKATVFLLYHCEYSFRCEKCDSASYKSQANKIIGFNRRDQICRNCHGVKILDPGNSKYKPNQIVDFEEAYATSQKLTAAKKIPPVIGSPIASVAGDRKIADPYQVINDPIQLKRYYGEHIWGYFRQIIKENEIKLHREVTTMAGPADEVAIAETISILENHKVAYTNYKEPNSRHQHIIAANHYAATPDFVRDYGRLVNKYHQHGIQITYDDKAIYIQQPASVPIIESHVKNTKPITTVTNQTAADEPNFLDIIVDDDENGIEHIDSTERLLHIRNRLPCDGAKKLFDILASIGSTWEEFSAKYSDRQPPHLTNIAEFLSVSPKQLCNWRFNIKAQMHECKLIPNRFQ